MYRTREVRYRFMQVVAGFTLFLMGYLSNIWFTPCMMTSHKVPVQRQWLPVNSSGVREVITESIDYIFKPYKQGTVSADPIKYEESKVKDVYYIKVHKTGSTTFQNIIYRYGFNHNLTFALFNCENAMPFPNAAYSKYFYPLEGNHSNIVLDHAFFDPDAFKPYMSDRTKVVSLLRHPLKYLESSFGFQYLDRSFNLVGKKDAVETFLKNPNAYDTRHRWKGSSTSCGPVKRPSFTKNAMAYHFGYKQQFNDSAASIAQFLQGIESQVSLVLILEKFDESLVLLKRMFKWTLKDISYLPLWSLKFHGRRNYHVLRNDNKTQNVIDLHRKWAPVDYALYDHHYNKLTHILDTQDQDFWDEVNHFKAIVKKLKSFCLSMCTKDYSYFAQTSIDQIKMELSLNKEMFAETKWNSGFVVTYLDCVTYSMATMEYHSAAKAKQMPELCQIPRRSKKPLGKLDSRYCNTKDYVVYNFSKSVLMHMLFSNRGLCQKRLNG